MTPYLDRQRRYDNVIHVILPLERISGVCKQSSVILYALSDFYRQFLLSSSHFVVQDTRGQREPVQIRTKTNDSGRCKSRHMSRLSNPRLNRISPIDTTQRQEANMASCNDIVVTNSINQYEMTQPLQRAALECIKEDDGDSHKVGQDHDISELFIITNQDKTKSPSPISSDCRWNLPDDDSVVCQDDRRLYKRLCLIIGVVCLVSICAFILTVLMLLGFVNGTASRRCSCPTNQGII